MDGRTDQDGHHLVPLTTGHAPGERAPSMAQAWPARVEVQRAVRRVLERMGPVDVVHLRMADVGTLAAATVAARHAVPVVFTLAPDPQAVIHRLDMTGELTRENFGAVDEVEHFWFRARLVQRLSRSVAHRVLFPRPRLADDLRELVGVDLDAEPRTSTVVPEGIDLTVARAAERDVRRGAADPGRRGPARGAHHPPAGAARPAAADVRRTAAPRQGHGDGRRGLGLATRRCASGATSSSSEATSKAPPRTSAPSSTASSGWSPRIPVPQRVSCWPVIVRLTWSRTGWPPPGWAATRWSHRAAPTSAAASRRSSGSPWWRRWPQDSSSSRRGAVVRRPSSTTG